LSVFRADTAAFYIQICSEDHKFLELNDAQLDSELTPRGYEFVSERPVSTSFPRTRLGETRDDKFTSTAPCRLANGRRCRVV